MFKIASFAYRTEPEPSFFRAERRAIRECIGSFTALLNWKSKIKFQTNTSRHSHKHITHYILSPSPLCSLQPPPPHFFVLIYFVRECSPNQVRLCSHLFYFRVPSSPCICIIRKLPNYTWVLVLVFVWQCVLWRMYVGVSVIMCLAAMFCICVICL